MTEEEMKPEEIAESEAKARKMLVEAVAIAALIEAGATQPSRVLPIMLQELRAVHVGDGDVRIFAIDSHGNIRNGRRGPMTAEDLAQEIAQKESFREIGWTRRHNQTPGTTTRRRIGRWQ